MFFNLSKQPLSKKTAVEISTPSLYEKMYDDFVRPPTPLMQTPSSSAEIEAQRYEFLQGVLQDMKGNAPFGERFADVFNEVFKSVFKQ